MKAFLISLLLASSANASYVPTPPKAPGFHRYTSTGTVAGYLFVVTSGNATVGATYTNNSNTYTVINTISSGTKVFMSEVSAPLASGTLTKSAGTGDSTLTFSSATAYANYTVPSKPSPLYIKIKLVGAGGGGSGSGTGSCGAGNPGKDSYFGALILDAGPGLGSTASSCVGVGGLGGSPTVNSPATALVSVSGAAGNDREYGGTLNGQSGTGGANSFYGGAGKATNGTAAVGANAAANTGSGGGGGGVSSSVAGAGAGGGGAGAYIEATIASPTAGATFPIIVGTKGTGGSGGTSGAAGGDGADGVVSVDEYYQ